MYLTEKEFANRKPDPELDRMMKLIDRTKDVECFEFEGCIYLGYNINAVKEFCKQTSLSFRFSCLVTK